jgi:RNA polymerase sigma factor for flagellar operon FliA
MSDLPNTLSKTARQLAESHLDLVEGIARGVLRDFPKANDLSELVSLGQMGLIDAATRYDPRHGASFPTYATYRIRGAIFDGLRKAMAISRRDLQKLQFQRRSNEYLEERSEEKTKDEAAEIDLLEGMVTDVAAIYLNSLDAMLENGVQVAVEQPNPEEELSTAELSQKLREARKKFDPKEREFLRLCYEEDLTLTEAGKRCGFSKGWASRLHTRLIGELAVEIGAPPPEVSL